MAKIVSNFVISEFCLKKMITFIHIMYFSYRKVIYTIKYTLL